MTTILDVKNPVYITAAGDAINCNVLFEGNTEYLPFTASTTENDAPVPNNKNNNLVPPTITNSIGVPSKK